MKRRSLVFGLLAMTMICAGSLERAVWADSKGNFPGKGSREAYNRACDIAKNGAELAKKGDFEGALKLDKQANSVYPYNSMGYHNVACDLYELKRYSEAVAAENKAIQLEPNFSGAWIKQGLCYEESGKYDEAEKCYRKANFINSDVETCFCIGDILTLKKRYMEAKPWYQKAKSLTTKPSQIAQIEGRLKKLQPMLEASH